MEQQKSYIIGSKWFINPRMRRLCAKRGASLIYIKEGIVPMVSDDEVCVANFNQTGDSWYLMPAKVYHEIVRAWKTEAEKEKSRYNKENTGLKRRQNKPKKRKHRVA
ncbi:hypothetical protein IJ098_03645 [Candidatus Saccharibacteria bacterium]|nr:hypothetical protein [Candidatus Saccharibacteria bacterium]